MSIADFSEVFRSKIMEPFKDYRVSKLRANPLDYKIADELRRNEQSQEKTTFILTESTLADARDKLLKYFPDTPEASVLLQRAIEVAKSDIHNKSHKITQAKTGTNTWETVIAFEEIPFGSKTRHTGIDAVIKEIFGGEAQRNALVGQESGIFQKGHVVGVATNLLAKSSKDIDSNFNKQSELLVNIVSNMIKDLRAYDFKSSNFGSEEVYESFGSYTKDSSKYLVELQLRTKNRDTGGIVGEELKKLRTVLGFGSSTEMQKTVGEFFSTIGKGNSGTKIFDSLVNMQTSPSMLQLIEADILEALDPIKYPRKTKKYFAKNVPIAQFTNKVKVNNDKLKQSLQKEIAKLEQLKAKIIRDSKDRLRNQRGQFISLANIQIIIQARLAEQIKQNMGNGLSKSILNLRTGRFAETAQIEKLTLQKDEVISIFYTYMKYPYATFEPGGRQGSPNSRNPVTLINKSIREIAAQLVTNRLRLTSV